MLSQLTLMWGNGQLLANSFYRLENVEDWSPISELKETLESLSGQKSTGTLTLELPQEQTDLLRDVFAKRSLDILSLQHEISKKAHYSLFEKHILRISLALPIVFPIVTQFVFLRPNTSWFVTIIIFVFSLGLGIAAFIWVYRFLESENKKLFKSQYRLKVLATGLCPVPTQQLNKKTEPLTEFETSALDWGITDPQYAYYTRSLPGDEVYEYSDGVPGLYLDRGYLVIRSGVVVAKRVTSSYRMSPASR